MFDTPDDPFTGGSLRSADDAGLLVDDGVITARGDFAAVRADHPDVEVVDLRAGVLLPGLVDAHVHYPQVRAMGTLGMPLLEWLERCALPEELRLGSVDYAREVAEEFVSGLVSAGTTTSLVFGSHFAPAVDALFAEAGRVGLRVTAGLVVSDRGLPEPLLTTAERAYDESLELAGRWHGVGRARYAVTPRFSYSAADEMLDACASVTKDVAGAWFTTHVNENPAEVAEVARLFVGALHYVDTYDRHGLVGERSVLAHNVHASDRELVVLAGRGVGVAHCPTSNSALGSGLFPRGGTSSTGSGWRSGPTSGPAPASRCSRRGCRPTSCSRCWVPKDSRSPRPTCSTSPPAPAPWRSASATRWATCRWASSSTRSGSARSTTIRSTSGSGTPPAPRMRSPRSSPSAATATSPASGSAATGSSPDAEPSSVTSNPR